MLRPERRTRTDLIAAAVITALVITAAALLWWSAPERATISRTAADPVPGDEPIAPTTVPEHWDQGWTAGSAVPGSPVLIAGLIVTGDDGAVRGHDPLTGAELWSYARDRELCAIAAHADRVVAVYRGPGGCAEITALDPRTGARTRQRSGPVDDQITLLRTGSHLVAAGPTRIEAWRSDLVRTVEYGRVDAPVQPDRQPRTGCTFVSVAGTAERIAVLEDCPDDAGERLTALRPDPKESAEPETDGSLALAIASGPVSGARVLAAAGDVVAVVVTEPEPLLIRYDGQGAQLSTTPLPAPTDRDRTGAPDPAIDNGAVLTWWTGHDTIALDAKDLTLRWILPGTLGPGGVYADRLVVPVPGGLAVVDQATGDVDRIVAVDRPGTTGPITVAGIGSVLTETAGGTLTAYLPAPGDAGE